MSEVNLLKLFEVLCLLAAGVAFGWWQLRDVKREQELSRRRREVEHSEGSEP